MKKYSRQREAIISVLKGTTSHPTAETIYFEVKKIYPSISLATVYRNLKEMELSNDLIVINSDDNKEHYDGNTSPHAHLYCSMCKAVEDVFLTDKQLEYINNIKESKEFQLMYIGLCKNCKNK